MSSYWITTPADTRSPMLVPAFGAAMGDVCPETGLGFSARTRTVDGIDVPAAHKGLRSWSPPVT